MKFPAALCVLLAAFISPSCDTTPDTAPKEESLSNLSIIRDAGMVELFIYDITAGVEKVYRIGGRRGMEAVKAWTLETAVPLIDERQVGNVMPMGTLRFSKGSQYLSCPLYGRITYGRAGTLTEHVSEEEWENLMNVSGIAARIAPPNR